MRARNKNIFNRLKAFIESAHDSSTSKEGKKALNKVLKSFDKALDASHGGVLLTDLRDDEEKENTEQEHGVGDERNSIKYPTFSDEDIKENIKALAKMDSVAFIDKSKLEKTGKNLKEIYSDFFSSLGNNIYSETFGDISLSNSSAKSEIRHGNTAEKIASIEAIPDVIEKGKVIFSKRKNGTDVERIIVAAPIDIGLDNYYMGVMLQRDTQNQRLYLHNVVSIKVEETKNSSQDDSLTNWSGEDNPRLFITSILQNAINVKLNRQKNKNMNERNSKKSENRGVTWSDLEPDIIVQAEANYLKTITT